MTKTYPIIHLNNRVYMVDESVPLEGKYLTDGVIVYHPTNSRDAIIRQLGGEAHLRKKVKPIIASNDPSLGLPILPSIEEDMPKPPRDWAPSLQAAYNIGYKAATKKYTEEDIKKAVRASIEDKEDKEKYLLNRIMSKLNPLPIAVEVSMSRIHSDSETYKDYIDTVTEGGKTIIQVKRWIWNG